MIIAVEAILQANQIVNQNSPSIASYIFGAFGILLSTGAVAWFFRSGIDVMRAKDKAYEAHALSTENSARVTALETRESGRDTEAKTTAAAVAALTAKVDDMGRTHNSDLRNLEAQYSRSEGVLLEIRSRLSPLDHIGTVIEASKNNKEHLEQVRMLLERSLVPRTEVDARFAAIEQRIENLQPK